ncbi:MAG: KEOPS complex N(6)-L-threonylcarbamoyladenine synthase Kae1 [Candidatus Methanofastidiosia archaeon]
MISLGIESTAHTYGVGIVDEEKVLSNISHSFKGVGIHPRKAADHHAEVSSKVLRKALNHARVSLKEVDVISFSQGPGMGPCLRIGATVARTLSLSHRKPLLGVNHCVAHVEIGRFETNAKDPVALYVSGGNTQIIAYAGRKYRVFGETLDIGIGNMQDYFGRKMGLEFPSGRALDKLFEKGKYLDGISYLVKGNDFAFSGCLTSAIKLAKKEKLEDVSRTLLENAFAMVVEATERAMAHTEKEELLLTGGVAASPVLKRMCKRMCDERGAHFYVPHFSLCRDNGAMIAYQGLLEFLHGKRERLEKTQVRQKWRVDEVEVLWR